MHTTALKANNCHTLELEMEEKIEEIEELSVWAFKLDLNEQVCFYLTGQLNKNNGMNFWVYIYGSQFEAKNYAYTLSMKGKGVSKFTYHDNVKSLDEAPNDIIAKQFLFSIGIEAVKKLVIEEKESLKWELEVTIHALKEEAKDEEVESGVEDDTD